MKGLDDQNNQWLPGYLIAKFKKGYCDMVGWQSETGWLEN
jgi:hypothetical protein